MNETTAVNGSDLSHINLGSCTNASHSATCEYTCNDGYSPGILHHGVGARSNPFHVGTCLNGLWSFEDDDGSIHGCVENSCGPVTQEDLPRVQVDACNGQYPAGAECAVQCSGGNLLVGDSQIQCVAGSWDTSQTRCVPSTTECVSTLTCVD